MVHTSIICYDVRITIPKTYQVPNHGITCLTILGYMTLEAVIMHAFAYMYFCRKTRIGLQLSSISRQVCIFWMYSTNHVYLHRFSCLRFCVCV